MSAEPVTAARPSPWTRADRPDRAPIVGRIGLWTALVALATGFVLIGGGNLDLGPIEARLGLSAGEGLGPFGQVFGGWEPALWPAQVAPSVLWAWGEAGGIPTSASVRWPAAIAGVLAGLILAHRAWGEARGLGRRADGGLLVRQRGADRPLGGGGPRPDRRPGDRRGARPDPGPGVRPDRGALGGAGLPGGGLAAVGGHRAGDPRCRPARGHADPRADGPPPGRRAPPGRPGR